MSLATKPGTYTLRVEGKDTGGKETAMSYLVRVSAAHYPISTIKVAPGFVEPPKETLPRLKRSSRKEAGIRDHSDPDPLWSGAFEPPAQSETSGVFGTARIFNGVKKSQHPGLDFRVTTGTPVIATNSWNSDPGPSALF